jgi:adenosylcobyric acid synthase
VSALAVQGTSSFAGKSFLTTALARSFARRGVRVAPFKAQNMSNNARVVAGGEIGVAQYLQALAAGLEPELRMNPVLVKPEGDTHSQVVVNGKPDLAVSRLPWRARAPLVADAIETALRSLLADFELVLIEGAGSPAEINLRDIDMTNLGVVELADASVVLVSDIDRGGSFAHLYGTWALIGEKARRRIGGFVLNKFRGDRSLLNPAPSLLEEMTGVPMLGVLPLVDHGLPDEDGAADPRLGGGHHSLVAVIRYPTASNLDEFRALEQIADLVWAREPSQLGAADLIVLPGSKHVARDLDWLRARGFAPELRERARRGAPILGICGGLQMLGEEIVDPAGVDGNRCGLCLLKITTTFSVEKIARRTETRFAPDLPERWARLNEIAVDGYEIRHGSSHANGQLRPALPNALGFASGSVLGVYLHGLFECDAAVRALFGATRTKSLETTFDELADLVDASLDRDRLDRLAGRLPRRPSRLRRPDYANPTDRSTESA